MRTSYMEGYDEPKPMEPETPSELTIRPGSDRHTVRARGTASGWTWRARTSRTSTATTTRGADFWSDSELRVARQTVLPRPRAPFASAALGGVEAPTRP